MKLLQMGIASAIATLALPAAASAAVINIDTSVPAGGFSNDNVLCSATAPCSFSNSGSFLTPTGFNRVSLTISTILSGSASPNPTNIDFGTVLFNSVAFALSPTGDAEFGSLLNQMLVAGGTNTISVAGTTGGNASYRGTLSFSNVAAVPEPGTWALMLVGFGAIGFSMRRRRSQSAHIFQAA